MNVQAKLKSEIKSSSSWIAEQSGCHIAHGITSPVRDGMSQHGENGSNTLKFSSCQSDGLVTRTDTVWFNSTAQRDWETEFQRKTTNLAYNDIFTVNIFITRKWAKLLIQRKY